MSQKRLLSYLIVVAVASQLFAQTSAGVNGTVFDSSGAVVSEASVTILSLDTGARRTTTTNEDGVYQFLILPSGRYALSVQKTGFKQVTQDDIRLELNQVARLDSLCRPARSPRRLKSSPPRRCSNRTPPRWDR